MRALAAAAMLLALTALPALAAEAQGVQVERFSVPSDGDTAWGWLAVPSATPSQLVVVCHGHHVSADKHVPRLTALAQRGALAVAMDYRGPLGFNVMNGSHDSIAATLALRAQFPTVREVVMLGISMGGEACGMAAAQRPDLFDAWVDVEGLSDLAETWAEATAAGSLAGEPDAAREIEDETGGTPVTATQAYLDRSPLVLAPAMRLHGAVVVHAVADGTVPYDQGRLLATALAAQGTPVDVMTVLRAEPGDEGTTLLSDFGLPNPLALAGHGYEADPAQTVIAAGDAALARVLDGHGPDGYHEFLVDAQLGTVLVV